MEFHEKLFELRTQKGLTQEELAAALYVSRAAVSKWESGRGYPNIDSLKAIAKFFSVSIDALLSGEEVMSIAEADSRQKETHLRDLVFGALDCSAAMLLFLPFFGQSAGERIEAVPLPALHEVAPYLKTSYFLIVLALVALGLLTLALQNCRHALWLRSKTVLSLLLNAAGVLLFIISSQPYAAVLGFVFLLIKGLLLIKKQ